MDRSGLEMLMQYKDFANVQVMEHPLIRHKISLMRKTDTGTYEFRKLVEEVATLEGYEALRDLPLKEVEITTPLEKTMAPMIDGKKLAIVPILRAGLGMVPGVQALTPCKLPDPIDQRLIVVVDPMLATGGSAVDAINSIKNHGGKNIKFMCIIAAPEGIEKLAKAHPDIEIYVGCVDRELNDNAYILPGLGDAGDRIFGTK